jgi:hypothetical protein
MVVDDGLPSSTLTTATEPTAPVSKRAKAEINEAKQQHTTVFSYVLWCFGVLPLEAGCHTNITPDVRLPLSILFADALFISSHANILFISTYLTSHAHRLPLSTFALGAAVMTRPLCQSGVQTFTSTTPSVPNGLPTPPPHVGAFTPSWRSRAPAPLYTVTLTPSMVKPVTAPHRRC